MCTTAPESVKITMEAVFSFGLAFVLPFGVLVAPQAVSFFASSSMIASILIFSFSESS